ncbi:uncharacterized protein BCR38DRAFT_406562 [Pseudomassariella vexata]|uniref:Uncharacterized protein n=1 Tax=Pseudomassariella vexata TaxID=1141098 RepID=A0A1Y2EAP8_9PEZI|nr:uncharacterized protein BCR38DRAFT_406562 [Pseudomassariella vexata]ORY68643.1 hypothetical protein BCR38DRAFT_406562 [Pseudomassariella vexata]
MSLRTPPMNLRLSFPQILTFGIINTLLGSVCKGDSIYNKEEAKKRRLDGLRRRDKRFSQGVIFPKTDRISKRSLPVRQIQEFATNLYQVFIYVVGALGRQLPFCSSDIRAPDETPTKGKFSSKNECL